MRDDYERHIERSAKRVDEILQLTPDGPVDGRKRFVEQQHGRFASQRASQRDTLAFAARQFGRTTVRLVGELNGGQQVLRAFVAFVRRPVTERGSNVAECRHVREERVLLEDEPDATLVCRTPATGRRVHPHVAANRHDTAAVSVQPRDRAQDRRLAAARRAVDAEHVTRLARERHVDRHGCRLTDRGRQRALTHDAAQSSGRGRW